MSDRSRVPIQGLRKEVVAIIVYVTIAIFYRSHRTHRIPPKLSSWYGWSALRSAIFIAQSESNHVLGDKILGYMLRKHIARVVSTQNVVQCKITFSDSILHPKIGSGKMSDLAESSSPGNTYSCSSIRHDSFGYRLQTESLGSSFRNPSKFSLR